MNLKEKIESIKRVELEKIKEGLTPHFGDFGDLYTLNGGIYISTNLNNYCILTINHDFTFRNNYSRVYNGLGIKRRDVFKEFGFDLPDLKINPATPFNVVKWKFQFVNKHDELYFKNLGFVIFKANDDIVIADDNNVNYEFWHNSNLTHSKFKFKYDRNDRVFLKTKKDCEEFEAIFNNYIDSQKYKSVKQLFPNLSPYNRSILGTKFATIAKTLDIDMIHDKHEDDYTCNGYNISQDKADMILTLIQGGK